MSVRDYCPICDKEQIDMKKHLQQYSKDQLIDGIIKTLEEYQQAVYESWGEDL